MSKALETMNAMHDGLEASQKEDAMNLNEQQLVMSDTYVINDDDNNEE